MVKHVSALVIAVLAGCPSPESKPDDGATPPDSDSPVFVDTSESDLPAPLIDVTVQVMVDGEPAAGVLVSQGGTPNRWTTGDDGSVAVTVQMRVKGDGDIMVLGAHPECRIQGTIVGHHNEGETVTIELERFDPVDHTDYVHQPPGAPGEVPTNNFCGHCHLTTLDDWYTSPHRTAASNPVVQDVYGGSAAAFPDESTCNFRGGTWQTGRIPGTGMAGDRCFIGDGTIEDLNPGCDPDDPCADATGACADCHAPGTSGELGGQDLLSATSDAYTGGVHCDVCHKVASVSPGAAPGVAGWLDIHRPEPGAGILTGELSFGPLPDVPNPRMGSVYREHFKGADFCGGCHQLDQEVLLPGLAADAVRWPSGRLPIHSTWAEHNDSPLAGEAPCQSCHMPPDPSVANAADIQLYPFAFVGVSAGWYRPPGSMRRHQWLGPRSPVGEAFLQRPLAVEVDTLTDGDEVVVDVTVSNIGAGHAVPTGEPMRSVLVRVEADCDGTALAPSGGAVVPDFGGYRQVQDATGDWAVWDAAEVGDVIRVVDLDGVYDYQGFGPFGDGTFQAADKGMPVENFAGQATVLQVDAGVVTLDVPLPVGDRAYLGTAAPWSEQGDPSPALAGAPGFGFARVLVGPDGERMVPHHRAVDVASDNRLLPGQFWTSRHRFAGPCPSVEAAAVVLHRGLPWGLSQQRGWSMTERVMAEERR